jgi:8-oxo-dGTP pyrophosphatase MutT (NUDIX family)
MTRAQSAAIPYRRAADNSLEVLLVTSRRQGRWVLPKGNIKQGMLPHTSAAREAFEEAGVVGLIERLPLGSYSQRKVAANGAATDVRVCAYAMLVNQELRNWPERAVRRRKWMRVRDAVEQVRDTALRSILASFENEFSSRDVFE